MYLLVSFANAIGLSVFFFFSFLLLLRPFLQLWRALLFKWQLRLVPTASSFDCSASICWLSFFFLLFLLFYYDFLCGGCVYVHTVRLDCGALSCNRGQACVFLCVCFCICAIPLTYSDQCFACFYLHTVFFFLENQKYKSPVVHSLFFFLLTKQRLVQECFKGRRSDFIC